MLVTDIKNDIIRDWAARLMENARKQIKLGYIKPWRNNIGFDIDGNFGGGNAFAGPWGIVIRFDNLSTSKLDDMGIADHHIHSNRY
jgi:hypothetical protein